MNIPARIAALLGEEPESFRPVSGGYTPAERRVVTLASGRRVFVKVGTTAGTAANLRREHAAYQALRGPFLPEFVAWEDDGQHPLLVLEDLSGARWPPPWDAPLITATRAALAALHASRAALRPFSAVHGAANDWDAVAADRAPFLALGLVSEDWLEHALPALVAAAGSVETTGEEPTHFDVRSDNLCLTERGVVLVDWNGACLGNGALDLGFWLPSLAAEGGPPPESILPDRPDVAAFVSGFFALRAGRLGIPGAPRVRAVQRAQLVPALAWAARALGVEGAFVHR
jgi:hypothetical protein